jgi:hypothetical protein
MYTFRTLSQDDFKKEFPDQEEEQTSPSTDVDTDTDDDNDESEKSKETTADALADAFKRVAKGQTVKPKVEISERKVSAKAAPEETSYTQGAASVALSAAIRKARGI